MTNAAKSIVAFGIYGMVAGSALFFQPDATLQLLGFQPTSEHWILIVALLLMGIGLYYTVLGVKEVEQFYFVSIVGRVTFFMVTVGLIMVSKAPNSLLLLGVIDLVSSVWTLVAIVRDRKA